MKSKKPDLQRSKKSSLLSASALCLLLFLTIQCGLLANQSRELSAENEALSAALVDKEQAIETQEKKADSLKDQLAKATSMEEHETETGFFKKGGVYLIDTGEQLWTLRRMVAEDTEIEPGIPAASASYRLRNDLYLNTENWFCIGTQESPFCGSFDGDGHCITGNFPNYRRGNPYLLTEEEIEQADQLTALFHNIDSAKAENIEIVFDPAESMHIAISAPWECTELEAHLPNLFERSIHLEIRTWNLDVRKAAEALRTYWERNEKNAGTCVSIVYTPDSLWDSPANLEQYIPNLHTALTTLAGAEYTRIIEDAMAQENGYLWFVRLERIDGLTCCIFEIDEPDEYGYVVNDNYYIILEGSWEGKKVARQCLSIPYTEGNWWSIGTCPYFQLESVDLNFDGKQDLLIHEGGSGGSGGSWKHYRAIVWEEDTTQFSFYPSFPASCVSLEFDRQRVVNHYRSGASYECVEVYGVVDGEYVCTRKLVLQSKLQGNEYVDELLYYEMDKLVETHMLSGDWCEKVNLYPDMDYWSKG